MRSLKARMTEQAKPISPPRRRFLRFSVRGLVVLVQVRFRYDRSCNSDRAGTLGASLSQELHLMRLLIRALSCYLFASVLLWPTLASATTIDKMTFEELVLGADFVGIVECDRAGGIVAGYSVLESWKGPRPGTHLTIRVAVNYWEPQFPITLCGERYFVTAFKQAPFRVTSATSGEPVPLWWRNIPADYGLPLFQGRKRLAPGEKNGADFQKIRGAAQKLLSLEPAEQHVALLKSVIEKELGDKRWVLDPDQAKANKLRSRLAKLNSANDLASELIRTIEETPLWARRAPRDILRKAGGQAALASLEKLPLDRCPWNKKELDELTAQIRKRVERKDADSSMAADPDAKQQAPSAGKLADLRKALAQGPYAEGFGEALEALTRHDPEPVVKYLVEWMNPNQGWRDEDRGYVLGSYFGVRCGKDRRKHFAALSEAKDPFVRVAGAVYLCFENAIAGTAELKRMTAVDGDPGVWAALTLARRGHKGAVPRALEVFRRPAPGARSSRAPMATVPHSNLQKRVRVLLSNSAHVSGAPRPEQSMNPKDSFESLMTWWITHADKLVLDDPWLPIVEKQKVD
jgi:hypothetical protein